MDMLVSRRFLRLVGCDWGYLVAIEGDKQPCDERAVQRIVLHSSDGSKELGMVQLCKPHADKLAEATDPHDEVNDGGENSSRL